MCGHTTGSDLGLRDEDESQLAVIWRAEVTSGLLTLWQIIEDTPARRQELGLGPRGTEGASVSPPSMVGPSRAWTDREQSFRRWVATRTGHRPAPRNSIVGDDDDRLGWGPETRTAGGDQADGCPDVGRGPLQRRRLLRAQNCGAHVVKAVANPQGGPAVISQHTARTSSPKPRGATALRVSVGWWIAPLGRPGRDWRLGAEQGKSTKRLTSGRAANSLSRNSGADATKASLAKAMVHSRASGSAVAKRRHRSRPTWCRARSTVGGDSQVTAGPIAGTKRGLAVGDVSTTWPTARTRRWRGPPHRSHNVGIDQDCHQVVAAKHPDMGAPQILMPPGSRGGDPQVLLTPPSLPLSPAESGHARRGAID